MAAVGLRFEAGLAQRVFEDVAGEPGAMPLLQHALRQTWGSVGMVAGSEQLNTKQLVASLEQSPKRPRIPLMQPSPEEKRLIRHILLRLTRLGEEERGSGPARRDTRRRRTLNELVPAGRITGTGARAGLTVSPIEKLLVMDGWSSVEIAHEALIRHWPELKRWLEQNPELLRLQDEIGRDAQRYHQADEELRTEHLLLQGTRLAQVEGLLEANQLTLSKQ